MSFLLLLLNGLTAWPRSQDLVIAAFESVYPRGYSMRNSAMPGKVALRSIDGADMRVWQRAAYQQRGPSRPTTFGWLRSGGYESVGAGSARSIWSG